MGFDGLKVRDLQGTHPYSGDSYTRLGNAMLAAVLQSLSQGTIKDRMELMKGTEKLTRRELDADDSESDADDASEDLDSQEEEGPSTIEETLAIALAKRDRLKAKVMRLTRKNSRLHVKTAKLEVASKVFAEVRRKYPEVIEKLKLERMFCTSCSQCTKLRARLPKLNQDDALKMMMEIESCLSSPEVQLQIQGINEEINADSANKQRLTDFAFGAMQQVAPKYGFEESCEGVRQMFQAVRAFSCLFDATTKTRLMDVFMKIHTTLKLGHGSLRHSTSVGRGLLKHRRVLRKGPLKNRPVSSASLRRLRQLRQ